MSLSPRVPVDPEVLFPLLSLLWIALGWPLAARRVPPNRWYGLRVPATFADRSVWYDANAVAGRDMVGVGIVLGLMALLLPRIVSLYPATYALVCALALGLGSLVFALRGWHLANRLLRERRGGTEIKGERYAEAVKEVRDEG
jgi:SdpI/YfhL protein family